MVKTYTTLWTRSGGSTAEARRRRASRRTQPEVNFASAESSPEVARIQEEQKQRLLSGVATQDTKSGAFLRGESVTTSTGETIQREPLEGLPQAQEPSLSATEGLKQGIDLGETFNLSRAQEGIIEGIISTTDLPLGDLANVAGLGIEHFAAALGLAVPISAIGAIGQTAVNALGMVGTTGVPTTAAGTAGTIATNPKNVALTTAWLSRVAGSLTSPTLIASSLVGAIGSYPFAGFIKEESLQTLSFAVNTATKNGDMVGAEEALALQREILNPSVWDEIVNKVPYANVINSLNDFYKAANIKLAIDSKMVEDMKIGLTKGETPEQTFERNKQEEENQYKNNTDYHNDQRKLMIQYELSAKRNARDDDAAFWRRERELEREREAADRQAIAEFWLAYQREKQKLAEQNRPSKLNFGLLR